ncbi:MAG: hypothetical protein NTZ04_01420 [Chloroflexi bacterium]|nr:hypothetical protein [Chloroflexota bacterium]
MLACANAAWWGITVLAYNLNSLMKRLVMPEGWAPKRMKAVRFGFINIAGRVSKACPSSHHPLECRSSGLWATAGSEATH